jgi:hypothetical protein
MYAPMKTYTSFLVPKEHFTDHSILNLIIYYPSPHEDAMKDILTSYLKTLPMVQFYFITLRPQEKEVVIEDHIMYIRGNETYVPGILDKTLRAIEYCHANMSYQYLVRSNISTVIDFTKLDESKLTAKYMGCDQNNLQWLDPYGGITDQSLWGTPYIGGIGIIMTPDTVSFLLAHKDEIRMDVVDDVSLGAFFTKYNQFSLKTVATTHYNNESPAICYRNRTSDRLEDVERMKRIVKRITLS